MSMFKLFDEMLEELCDEYTIDEIMDALDELTEEIYNQSAKSEPKNDIEHEHKEDDEYFECDGDCDNCVYGQEVDDSDAYEYGKFDDVDDDCYRAFEAALKNDIENAFETVDTQNKLWDEYKKAQNDLEKSLDEYDSKIDGAMFGDCDCEHDDVYDSISHPYHYASHGIETIDKIEAVVDGLPAKEATLLANIIKYVDRAGLKDNAEKDLAKANAYAHRLVYGHWRTN